MSSFARPGVRASSTNGEAFDGARRPIDSVLSWPMLLRLPEVSITVEAEPGR